MPQERRPPKIEPGQGAEVIANIVGRAHAEMLGNEFDVVIILARRRLNGHVAYIQSQVPKVPVEQMDSGLGQQILVEALDQLARYGDKPRCKKCGVIHPRDDDDSPHI